MVINATGVLPPGIEAKTMGAREYSYLAPGMSERVRVTTDAGYYEQHADSVELWSPGNPLFPAPDNAAPADEIPAGSSLPSLLHGSNAGAAEG